MLSHRTGQPQEREGHQLAVVAFRDGQLYRMCTDPSDGPAAGEAEERRGKERKVTEENLTTTTLTVGKNPIQIIRNKAN